jgi:FixJ family two-component response regulator
MPAITGIELYRRLIDAGRAIPTILVTAYPNDVDQARALNEGVVCYLRKPVDEQHLMRCLRAAFTSGEPSGEGVNLSGDGTTLLPITPPFTLPICEVVMFEGI